MLRYAITAGRLTDVHGPQADRLLAHCERLAQEKIDFLLLREKALALDQLALLARRIVALTRSTDGGSAMRIVVHSDAGLALAAGAAGVHVTDAALVRPARAVFAEAWISVSCHSLAEVRAAREAQASAILYAPVFGKSVDGVEVAPATGLDRLREACAEADPMPLFALGGVTPENAAACIAAGARGVAGIRLFFGAA